MIQSVGSSQYDLQIGTVVDLPDNVANELLIKGFAVLPDEDTGKNTKIPAPTKPITEMPPRLPAQPNPPPVPPKKKSGKK